MSCLVYRLSDIKELVSQLYEALHIQEHQLQKERELYTRLETLQTELQPLEEVSHSSSVLKN